MSTEPIEELKRLILLRCGMHFATSKNCKKISEQIFLQDNNYLSESTIKRIFGFIAPPPAYHPFV